MTIELTDKEQSVLNAACVRIEQATQQAQSLQRAAEQAARKAESLGHEARGIFRSIMELSGRNPDAHEVKWDGAAATVYEKTLPAEIPMQIDTANVVPLPSPSYPPAPGDDGDA